MLNEQENSYTISVIITTFNRITLLERALISLESQSFKDFEVIISDDCSDVDVYDFLERYKKGSQLAIRYRRNSENKGACYTRNQGIKMAKGEYITGLDDDDEFTPDRLSYLVENLDDKYSFITSNTLVISKKKTVKLFGGERVVSFSDFMWDNLIGTQILIKKELITKVGGFDVNLTSAQDSDMWARLLREYGPALRLSKPTYILHTEHDESRVTTSNNKIDGMILYRSKYEIFRSKSQNKLSNFRLKYWENNRKLHLSMLRYFDFYNALFLVKKIFKKV